MKQCQECGKDFTPHKFVLGQIFCSKVCKVTSDKRLAFERTHPNGRLRKRRAGYVKELSKELIQSLYVDERKTQKQVAEVLGITTALVQNAMRRFGIPRRDVSEREYKSGPSNSQWKGEAATYKALHLRVGNLRGRPKKCEQCGTTDTDKRYEWASLTKNYADPYDYIRLCKRCHLVMDGVLEALRKSVRRVNTMRCIVCNTETKTTANVKLFCSNKCYRHSLNERKRRVYVPLASSYKELKCLLCSTKFKPSKKIQRFCSKACQVKSFHAANRKVRTCTAA